MATTSTASAPTRLGASGAKRPGERDTGATSGDGEAGAARRTSIVKSKKFLIAVVALLAVAGGAYKFLVPHPAGPPTGGDVVSMEATTLNLAGGHYLKIAISVQLVKGKATATDFSTSEAAELTIDEFSNRTVASLSSNKARQKLVDDLLVKVQDAYPGEVYDVFVTQFVTQ